MPHPQEGGGVGAYGISASTLKLTQGETDVVFSKYSGETDSGTKTTNTWSIQANTNEYWGNNHLLDWVQFTYQNWPSAPNGMPYEACIWQNYEQNGIWYYNNNVCTGSSVIPAQTLSSTYNAYVEGYVQYGQLQVVFCSNQQNNCWGISTNDFYGLGGQFYQISGTILGYCCSSSANFTPHTSETTESFVSDAPYGYQFNCQAVETAGLTGETNNLNYGTPQLSSTGTTCTVLVGLSN